MTKLGMSNVAQCNCNSNHGDILAANILLYLPQYSVFSINISQRPIGQ